MFSLASRSNCAFQPVTAAAEVLVTVAASV
jgi:hypothetical protein